MIYQPYEYQLTASRWIKDKKRCALLLDMGLGKSVITLSALHDLIDDCEISRILVVAPKKVAETTWTTEADKWDHLRDLRVSKVIGTEKQRKLALSENADIYVIGRDSFVWLVALYGGAIPFDAIVIDELTSFKSSHSQRFKAMRMASASVNRVIGLTGTPAPNGLIDLWAEMYCIDQGERLGKSITRYREKYFNLFRRNNIILKCDIKKGCEKEINSLISDVCLSMQAKDYLSLPKLIMHKDIINFSEKVMKGYTEFEKNKVLEFFENHNDDNENVIARSAAGLMNKLSQYSNGAVYDDDKNAHEVHTEKLDRLEEIIEAANGSPVLVFYGYKHDVDRISKKLKGYKVEVYQGEKQLNEWNACKIDVLLAHPASTAYGLNMQQGGHYIVWFSAEWNLELFLQANARLHRQGQPYPVHVYKMIARGTVDERADAALDGKKNVQQSLLDSLRYLKTKYNG